MDDDDSPIFKSRHLPHGKSRQRGKRSGLATETDFNPRRAFGIYSVKCSHLTRVLSLKDTAPGTASRLRLQIHGLVESQDGLLSSLDATGEGDGAVEFTGMAIFAGSRKRLGKILNAMDRDENSDESGREGSPPGLTRRLTGAESSNTQRNNPCDSQADLDEAVHRSSTTDATTAATQKKNTESETTETEEKLRGEVSEGTDDEDKAMNDDTDDTDENGEDADESEAHPPDLSPFVKNTFRVPKFWISWRALHRYGPTSNPSEQRLQGSGYIVFSGNECRTFQGTLSCDGLGLKNASMKGWKESGRVRPDCGKDWSDFRPVDVQ